MGVIEKQESFKLGEKKNEMGKKEKVEKMEMDEWCVVKKTGGD